MPVAGLDISDQSVKCAQVVFERGEIVVRKIGERAVPAGVIEAGQVKDRPELENALRLLKEEFELESVAVSLPEEQAYIVRIRLPRMRPNEIRSSIELQLEEYIPMPLEEAVFDYELMSDNGPQGCDVAVSVLPRATVAAYTDAIRGAGLVPLAMEIEAQALARSLIPWGDKSTSMIIDIGKTRTGFSVVSQGKVAYTSTLNNIGGEDLTKSIQKNLGISYQEAERLKIEKGLTRAKSQQELFFALVPALAALRDEILKVYTYWNAHKEDSGITKRKIEAVVLCGGQSSLPGLVPYLSSGLPVPVEIGNPWTNILSVNDRVPPLDQGQTMRYSTALGLSLRNLKRVV